MNGIQNKAASPAPALPNVLPPQPPALTSAAQLTAILDSSPDAILALTLDGIIVNWSTGAERIYGYPRPQALGQSLRLLMPPECAALLPGLLARVQRGETLTNYETVRVCRDGQHRNISLQLSPIRDERGTIVGISSIEHDLTPRTRARLALVKRAQTLSEIHRAVLVAPSPEALARVVLGKISSLLPYSRATILIPDPRQDTMVILASTENAALPFPPGTPVPFAPLHRHNPAADGSFPDGIEITTDLSESDPRTALFDSLTAAGVRGRLRVPLRVDAQLGGVLDLFADMPVTPTVSQVETASQLADTLALALQQARLHEQVSITRERLLALSHRQIELKEIERRQMTRDLHDMLGQDLSALNFNLHYISRNLPADTPPAVRTRFDDSSGLLEQVVARIRNMMSELRPPVLDDLGLNAALHWYAGEFSARAELPIYVQDRPLVPRLPPPIETALFRITQEALNNIAKHAQAHHINIFLDSQPGIITLIIADDGIGFDFPALRRTHTHNGVGLVDMRERAEAVGGSIWVETQPGQGTQVIVHVPGTAL